MQPVECDRIVDDHGLTHDFWSVTGVSELGGEVEIDIEFDKEPKKVPGGASIPKGFYKHLHYTSGKSCYYFPNEAPKKFTYKDYQIQCK